MSLIKTLAKETAIYGISSILVRLLPFAILTPFYTRRFGDFDYGIITEVYTWAALLMVVFTYRMETTFFRFGSKKEQFEKSFSTSAASLLCSTILFGGLLLAFLTSFASLLSLEDYKELVLYLVLIVGFDALTAIPFASLRLKNKPIRFAIFKSLNIVLNIGLVFFFLKFCPWVIDRGWTFFENFYDPTFEIKYVFLSNLCASLLVLILFLPTYFKLKLRFDIQLWKRMITYTLPLFVVGIAGVINQFAGNTMIKELSSEGEASFDLEGIYGAAAKLAVFMNLFTQAFNFAAEPFFFNNADRKDAKNIYASVAKAFTIVGSFGFLSILLYLDLLKYFIGNEGSSFHQGLGLVPFLLIAYLLLGIYYNFSIWYKLTDKTRIGAMIAVGGSIITITLNFILIPNPNIGYFGPAYAAVACYGFMCLAGYFTGQRHFPIPYPIRNMIIHVLIAMGFYGLSIFIRPILEENLWYILPVNTLIMLSYLGLVYFLERKFIKEMIRG